MNVIDMVALRALVAEEVRSQLAGQPRVADRDPPNESAGTLWTADDVARFLKASRSWVYAQAEAGRLPCTKVVGLLRFDPATVRAFARGRSEQGGKVLSLTERAR